MTAEALEATGRYRPPRGGGHAARAVRLATQVDWGIPPEVTTLLVRTADLARPAVAGDEWGCPDFEHLPPEQDRPVVYAVGSLPWRALRFNAQQDARERAERERRRRLRRRLEHADAEVTRCTWCGEWRLRGQVCEVRGCASPWQTLATRTG